MTIQTINLGTAPSGAGGDTFRSTGTKMNENFTNWAHAASRMVGDAEGNVMEVGAFGLGSEIPVLSGTTSIQDLIAKLGAQSKFTYSAGSFPDSPFGAYSLGLNLQSGGDQVFVAFDVTGKKSGYIAKTSTGVYAATKFYTDQNTTVDSNGFIKAASPIIKLFSNKIELNDEAQQQEIVFEKLGTGNYLIKGSTGFAQEGWYVETPKDANGNVLFSVIYITLENGDILVKTYKKKFDLETASIGADLNQPIDITENRWIDIRLQEIPKPVPEMPVVTENDPE
ncbi:hypothetical protein [Acinetobacter junii]|uniref:phage tail fiber protein n=1 Tax=Acinetobacter junii TaxID=40215 RepID=UPI002446EFA8|nr:hypothetical protein [Acinetobacter junii]MDH1005667.1 hypothetical protein [Acinetobacter junii]MDH1005738.1 hypothetical protein [Acinetobacter junii]